MQNPSAGQQTYYKSEITCYSPMSAEFHKFTIPITLPHWGEGIKNDGIHIFITTVRFILKNSIK